MRSMARTESTMPPLGVPAPAFSLADAVSGRTVTLDTFADKQGLLVIFLCCHCPFVVHVQGELGRLSRDYESSSLGIVGISSNDLEAFPQDSPEHMKRQAEEQGFRFPYCRDDSQQVARAYRAACTPDFFLFDRDRKLVYRGQLDDSRPGSLVPVTGRDLRAAVDAVLAGKPVSAEQRPSLGCNIKWKTK